MEGYVLPNGLRRLGRYDLMLYTAYARRGSTFDLRVRLDLKEKLRRDVFQRAVSQALAAYPEFAVRPVLWNGGVWYEENRAPVMLGEDDGRIYYFGADGEDGANGYLFLFLCGERHVTFSWFHGLTDARGGVSFISAVMLRYVKLLHPWFPVFKKTLTQMGIRLTAAPAEAMSDPERWDPVSLYAADCAPDWQMPETELFRLPPEPGPAVSDDCHLLNLTLPNDAFYQRVKDMHTSFAPLLAAILDEALCRAYDVGDRTVAVSNSVDPRRLFHTRTLGNMAVTFPLPITAADRALPLAERCAKLSALMRAQITENNVRAAFAGFLKLADQMEAMGEIAAANRVLTDPAGDRELTPYTVALTYPGRTKNNLISVMGIRRVTPGMVTQARGVVVYVYKNELTVQVSQKSDDLTLVNAICDVLREMGFRPAFSDMGRVTQNQLVFERLKRMPQQ